MDESIKNLIKSEVAKTRTALLLKLDELNIDAILDKMNVYLQATISSNLHIILHRALAAHVYASQESVYGNVLERIAIAVCGLNSKSSTTGVDLDFQRGRERILMALKSGENWSNSSSAKTQSKNLTQAKRTIKQNDKSPVTTMVGHCCGRRRTSNKSQLADITISGQNTWYLISGDKEFYKKIAHEMNSGTEEFEKALELKKQETFNRLLNELHKLCPEEADIWDFLTERCCKNYSDDDRLLKNIMES